MKKIEVELDQYTFDTIKHLANRNSVKIPDVIRILLMKNIYEKLTQMIMTEQYVTLKEEKENEENK